MDSGIYQRWISGKDITADDARRLIETCPRCVECPGQEHHWLPLGDSIDPEDTDLVAEFRRDHPQAEVTEELLLGHQSCKHCPAVRPYDVDDAEDDILDEFPDHDPEAP